MNRLLCLPLVLALLGLPGSAARAHFNILLPHAASVKRGEAVTLTYQWGHPFEHQLCDAPAPDNVRFVAPDGKTIDLTRALERVRVPAGEGKKVTAYRFRFTPPQRGDYTFLLQTPPILME